MTCREFVDFLWRYFSRELSNEERFEFDAHLAVCPACVAYLETYRGSIELAREALPPSSNDPVPEEVPEDLVQAILAAREQAG